MNRPLRSGASCAFLRAPPYAVGGILAAFPSHLLGAYSGSRFFVNSQLHLIGDRITDKPSAFLEMIGLEPTTSCMPCKRSSQVSYTPVFVLCTITKFRPYCQECGHVPPRQEHITSHCKIRYTLSYEYERFR